MAEEDPSHGQGGRPSLDRALCPAQTLTWVSRFYNPHSFQIESPLHTPFKFVQNMSISSSFKKDVFTSI